jgi:hypothetical protein
MSYERKYKASLRHALCGKQSKKVKFLEFLKIQVDQKFSEATEIKGI